MQETVKFNVKVSFMPESCCVLPNETKFVIFRAVPDDRQWVVLIFDHREDVVSALRKHSVTDDTDPSELLMRELWENFPKKAQVVVEFCPADGDKGTYALRLFDPEQDVPYGLLTLTTYRSTNKAGFEVVLDEAKWSWVDRSYDAIEGGHGTTKILSITDDENSLVIQQFGAINTRNLSDREIVVIGSEVRYMSELDFENPGN